MRQVLVNRLKYLRKRTGFQWGGGEIVLAGILIFGILSMGSGMFGNWLRSSREGGLLMVDLHSFSSANYGVDEMPVSLPAIGLEIIQDLLGVRNPPGTRRPGGISLITPGDPTPTPTLRWIGAQPETSIPEESIPGDSTPIGETRPTNTPRRSTPTSHSPGGTKPPRAPSATEPPSATAWPDPTKPAQATHTPEPTVAPSNTPQPSPVPSNTPAPSPTPQPAVSPTPRPTRSSTLAVTPTAVYTPVTSPGPPVLP